jgi:hypothetical protein
MSSIAQTSSAVTIVDYDRFAEDLLVIAAEETTELDAAWFTRTVRELHDMYSEWTRNGYDELGQPYPAAA